MVGVQAYSDETECTCRDKPEARAKLGLNCPYGISEKKATENTSESPPAFSRAERRN